MNQAKRTIAISRSTGDEGDAVIAAPGAGYCIEIIDGSLKQVDPGNDNCTATIQSAPATYAAENARDLDTWPLTGGVHTTNRISNMVADENHAVYVVLSTAADLVGSFTYRIIPYVPA